MDEYKIDRPDWSIFRDHVDEYLSKDLPDYARKITDLTFFSCLPDEQVTNFFDKMTFQSIDQVPPCIKYLKPSDVKFINADPVYCNRVMKEISVDLLSLINIDHDHFLCLHPARYNNVKHQIAMGEIVMPLVCLCRDGYPEVVDGRHRIVSMHKYGFETMEILVPEEEVVEIKNQLDKSVDRICRYNDVSQELSENDLANICYVGE